MTKKLHVMLVGILFLFFISKSLYADSYDADTLLQQYLKSISSMDNFSVEFKVKSSLEGLENRSYEKQVLHRKNGDLIEWLTVETAYEGDKLLNSDRMGDVFGAKKYIYMFDSENEQDGVNRATAHRSANNTTSVLERKERASDVWTKGSFLRDRIWGNNLNSIPELLALCDDLSISSETEQLLDNDCYILHGTNQFGKVEAWICPNYDHKALRWRITKNRQHIYKNGKPLEEANCTKWIATYEAQEMQKCGKQIIPAKASLVLEGEYITGETFKYHDAIEVNSFEDKPDFEALRAFTIHTLKLPEGSRVYDSELPGMRFEYINGKLIVDIDEFAVDLLENTSTELKKDALFKNHQQEEGAETTNCTTDIQTEGTILEAKESHTDKNYKSTYIMIGTSLFVMIGLATVAVLRLRKR